MLNFLIFILIFIVPFVVLPFGASFFETPKVILSEILIEVIVCWAIFTGHFKFPKKDLAVKAAILTLFLLSLIGLILSGFKPEYFLGNATRMQGVFLFWNLLCLFIISFSLPFYKVPDYFYLFCLSILTFGTLTFGHNLAGRSVGPLGEPNSLSATALFFLPVVLMSKKNWIKVLSLLLTVVIIYLSGSRSAFLALFLMLVLVGLKLKLSNVKSIVIIGLLLCFSLFLPFIEGGGWFENRSEIWKTALIAGLDKPILGSGFGSIEDSLHRTSLKLNNNVQYQIVDSSHNVLLDFFLQGGMLGLGLFLFIIYLFFRSQNELTLIMMFVGVFTVMLFNPVSVVNLVEFWWILGRGMKQVGHIQN